MLAFRLESAIIACYVGFLLDAGDTAAVLPAEIAGSVVAHGDFL